MGLPLSDSVMRFCSFKFWESSPRFSSFLSSFKILRIGLLDLSCRGPLDALIDFLYELTSLWLADALEAMSSIFV